MKKKKPLENYIDRKSIALFAENGITFEESPEDFTEWYGHCFIVKAPTFKSRKMLEKSGLATIGEGEYMGDGDWSRKWEVLLAKGMKFDCQETANDFCASITECLDVVNDYGVRLWTYEFEDDEEPVKYFDEDGKPIVTRW